MPDGIISMKLLLTYQFDLEDGMLSAEEIESNLENSLPRLTDVANEEGRIIILLDGEDVCGEYSEPLIRLVDQWLRKVNWLISGDTETLAFRNSEQCFGFIPSGKSVEFSFYDGTELEVEEYVVEPVLFHLDRLVLESIALGERVIQVLIHVDPELSNTDGDCIDLKQGLEELKASWHNYELHERR